MYMIVCNFVHCLMLNQKIDSHIKTVVGYPPHTKKWISVAGHQEKEYC